MKRARRYVAPILGLALIGAGWASSATAQEAEDGPRLVLREIDSSGPEVVRAVVSWSGDVGQLDGLTVSEDGEDTDAAIASGTAADVNHDVVFVVDSSASTDANALLTNVEERLNEFVAALPQGMRVSIVTAGATAQVLQPFTVDAGMLSAAVTDLTPSGEGGVLAGVVHAAARIETAQNVGTVILFTDGSREESISASVASAALHTAGAMLHVIALDEDGLDQGLYRNLAEDSGGTLSVTDDPEALGAQLDSLVPELTQFAVAEYVSEADRGIQDVTVRVADSEIVGSYIVGSRTLGAQRLESQPGVEPSGPSFLRTDLGKSLGFIGVLAAAILFTFGMVSIFVREDTGLSQVLLPYSDGYVGEEQDEEAESTQSAFLRRAVQATESFAERQGFLERVEHQLEKADLPLRAGEAMFFYLAVVLLLIGLAFALTTNPLGAFVIGLVAVIAPPAALNFLAARKKKKFEALLPDTLQLLSSTLRAGYSMMQGVEAVSQEAAEPMGNELRRVVTEARLGRPLEEALDGIAERMGSDDFGWAVMAIRIQREVGGNLSELLMTVAETMTHRERLRRDVSALTAEGRISAYVLGSLPVGLGFVLWGMNPEYIGRLFDHPMGQVMLGVSLLFMAIGFAWMFKIIKIEI